MRKNYYLVNSKQKGVLKGQGGFSTNLLNKGDYQNLYGQEPIAQGLNTGTVSSSPTGLTDQEIQKQKNMATKP